MTSEKEKERSGSRSKRRLVPQVSVGGGGGVGGLLVVGGVLAVAGILGAVTLKRRSRWKKKGFDDGDGGRGFESAVVTPSSSSEHDTSYISDEEPETIESDSPRILAAESSDLEDYSVLKTDTVNDDQSPNNGRLEASVLDEAEQGMETIDSCVDCCSGHCYVLGKVENGLKKVQEFVQIELVEEEKVEGRIRNVSDDKIEELEKEEDVEDQDSNGAGIDDDEESDKDENNENFDIEEDLRRTDIGDDEEHHKSRGIETHDHGEEIHEKEEKTISNEHEPDERKERSEDLDKTSESNDEYEEESYDKKHAEIPPVSSSTESDSNSINVQACTEVLRQKLERFIAFVQYLQDYNSKEDDNDTDKSAMFLKNRESHWLEQAKYQMMNTNWRIWVGFVVSIVLILHVRYIFYCFI